MLRVLSFAAAGFTAQWACAQTPPLIDAVQSVPGVSIGQVNTATTVQFLCRQLTTPATAPEVPTAQITDLTNRCSELVRASRAVQPGTGSTTLAAAVSQLSGVQVTSQGALATQVPAGQFSNIGARLSALRFGTVSIAGRGSLVSSVAPANDTFHVADDYAHGFYTKDGDGPGNFPDFRRAAMVEARSSTVAAAQSGAAARPLVANPWGFFLEGGYSWGNRDQTLNENGFKFDSFSVTGGFDYNFGNAVFGVSIGADRYKADFANRTILLDGSEAPGGESKVDGVSGSFFGAWFDGPWSLNGILSGGKLSTEVVRTVSYSPALTPCPPALAPCGASQTLSGRPHGTYDALGATLAYDAKAAQWTITPSLSLNFRHVRISDYTETNSDPTGGLALSFDSQAIDSMRSILGVNLSRSFSETFGILTPNFRVDWNHEYKQQARTLTMKFANDPYAGCQFCFTIPTDKPASDYGIVGIGLSALFSQRLQAYFYYERLVGVSYLKSNALSVGLRGQF